MADLAPINRLGKNNGGYSGETIDISSVLEDGKAAAGKHGWEVGEILADPQILVFSRPASNNSAPVLRLYLSTGIHGDEPAGPLAMRHLMEENAWPAEAELRVCPCLNPNGFRLNRRENADGVDLNRQYLKPSARETAAHIEWLQRQPAFDLTLCLHEDWESGGFYLYELNPDRRSSLAESMIQRVSKVCPVDHSEVIEGRAASGGIIRPDIDPRTRPAWAEAFFLIMYKTRLSYTLEAPSDFAMSVRVAALAVAVRAAIEELVGARK